MHRHISSNRYLALYDHQRQSCLHLSKPFWVNLIYSSVSLSINPFYKGLDNSFVAWYPYDGLSWAPGLTFSKKTSKSFYAVIDITMSHFIHPPKKLLGVSFQLFIGENALQLKSHQQASSQTQINNFQNYVCYWIYREQNPYNVPIDCCKIESGDSGVIYLCKSALWMSISSRVSETNIE